MSYRAMRTTSRRNPLIKRAENGPEVIVLRHPDTGQVGFWDGTAFHADTPQVRAQLKQGGYTVYRHSSVPSEWAPPEGVGVQAMPAGEGGAGEAAAAAEPQSFLQQAAPYLGGAGAGAFLGSAAGKMFGASPETRQMLGLGGGALGAYLGHRYAGGHFNPLFEEGGMTMANLGDALWGKSLGDAFRQQPSQPAPQRRNPALAQKTTPAPQKQLPAPKKPAAPKADPQPKQVAQATPKKVEAPKVEAPKVDSTEKKASTRPWLWILAGELVRERNQ